MTGRVIIIGSSIGHIPDTVQNDLFYVFLIKNF